MIVAGTSGTRLDNALVRNAAFTRIAWGIDLKPQKAPQRAQKRTIEPGKANYTPAVVKPW